MHTTASVRNRTHERHDLLGIVESAYAPQPRDATWLRQVAVAAKPAFDRGEGVLAAFVNAPDRELRDSVLLDCNEAHYQFAVRGREILADHEVARVCRDNQVLTTARRFLGLGPGEAIPGPLRQLAEECGFVDAALLLVSDPTGFGLLLGAPFRGVWKPSRRERCCWSRIATHLAAGYRLQRHASTLLVGCSSSGDEAVLEPDGKIQHAEGAARDVEARHWLRHAALAMDRARTSLRRENPDAAVAVWEGLVAGRWSLVDHFDRDGRRYLVARKNDPDARASTALTRREQQVLSYATLGRSNKFIAYELGVSESNICECLKQARTKLGVRSTAELIQLAGRLSAARSRCARGSASAALPGTAGQPISSRGTT